METIVNKVAQSGLVTLNLEQFLPQEDSYAGLDIAPFLFKGMILREKDFRAALPEFRCASSASATLRFSCTGCPEPSSRTTHLFPELQRLFFRRFLPVRHHGCANRAMTSPKIRPHHAPECCCTPAGAFTRPDYPNRRLPHDGAFGCR